MQLPDYSGRSIVNLMASLQQGLHGAAHAYPTLSLLSPEQVRAHRQVLLLVIDGLGLNYLRAHPQAACLNLHLAGGITSVFPPTTATAITTYLTGDAPQQHGLTGWHMYFRELASVMAILPCRARFGGVTLGEAGIDVGRLLGHAAFADRIGVPAYMVSPAVIADSDFNRAHRGRAQSVAYDSLEQMFDLCRDLLHAPGAKYVYAYWPELDSLGHSDGISSPQVAAHLLELDARFSRLLDQVRGSDALIVVCADHGQIDPSPGHRIDLDDHPQLSEHLVLPLCGEPRTAYCYLKPGHETAFDDYVDRYLGAAARCLSPAEVIASGWFGIGTPHRELANRIGDRVLLMRRDYVLNDRLPQQAHQRMVGVHGGLSDDELWVPLVVAGV